MMGYEIDLNDYLAFTHNFDVFYCRECAERTFLAASSEQGGWYSLEAMINGNALQTIHEDTFQFEQFIGEYVPLCGIRCTVCGNELYPAYGEEEGYEGATWI